MIIEKELQNRIIEHFEVLDGDHGYHYSTIAGDNAFFWVVVRTLVTNSDIWFLAELQTEYLGLDTPHLSIEIDSYGGMDVIIKFF